MLALRRWCLATMTFAIAMAAMLASTTPASAVTPSWARLNANGSSWTQDSPDADFSPAQNAELNVWRGGDNNNIYIQGQYTGSPLSPAQQMPTAQALNAPTVTAVGSGFMIFHRGMDNRIYYTQNFGRSFDAGSFANWQAITVNGQAITTNDTPVASEINGSVTLAYRGTNNRLYTVEAGLGSNISWNNQVEVGGETAWGPALANYRGTQYLFWNSSDQGHRIQYAARWSGQGTQWHHGLSLPGSPYTVGRVTAVALGDRLEVGALQADFNGNTIPANSPDGYSLWRTTFDGNSWSNASVDPQGYRSHDAPTMTTSYQWDPATGYYRHFFMYMMVGADLQILFKDRW